MVDEYHGPGACPLCVKAVDDVAGHIASAHDCGCCQPWTAADDAEMRERFGLPSFGSVEAIAWSDGTFTIGAVRYDVDAEG